jgi:hypothetical protein
MAKTLVYNERFDGVLRQNNWRFILGGDWGDGIKNSQRMRDYDIFEPRARYCYEAAPRVVLVSTVEHQPHRPFTDLR